MAAADLRAIINASGSEDHSTGNLELVAMTFGAISRLDHTISDEVCLPCNISELLAEI